MGALVELVSSLHFAKSLGLRVSEFEVLPEPSRERSCNSHQRSTQYGQGYLNLHDRRQLHPGRRVAWQTTGAHSGF